MMLIIVVSRITSDAHTYFISQTFTELRKSACMYETPRDIMSKAKESPLINVIRYIWASVTGSQRQLEAHNLVENLPIT